MSLTLDKSLPIALQPDASLALGQRLASQRKVRAMSIEEVAQRLKLTEAVVLALESDKWGATGLSEAFMRGYARNYAQLLGMSLDHQWANEANTQTSLLSSVNQLDEHLPYVSSHKVNPRWRWLWLLLMLALVSVVLFSQASLWDEGDLTSWLSHEKK